MHGLETDLRRYLISKTSTGSKKTKTDNRKSMDKLIEAVSLTKIYRSASEAISALGQVSLVLKEGDYLAIVGPSGAGKSTLLHILGGLDSPTKGKVFFKDKDIYRLKDSEISFWRNKHVGFVFQFYHLVEELNVLENATFHCG